MFLTVCLLDRTSRLLASEVTRFQLHRIWSVEARFWRVGDYVLMPNHLHLFCTPEEFPARCSIERWVDYWKSRATVALGWEAGQWQYAGFHYRLRSPEEYQEKWNYVRQNPVRAGLATSYEEWPFKGQVERLEWAW